MTTTFISKKLINNNFYLFPIFLVAFNIFLISYSQELRVYSILIFFGSLSLLFFIKLLDSKPKNFDAFCFFISLLFFAALHLFSLFLIGAFILYLFLIYIKKKKTCYLLYLTLSVISLISIFYYGYYILNFSSDLNSNLDVNYSWNKSPDVKFYTNFYFSNFFGSRIMGGIFLILFILLVVKKFKVFTNLETSLILLFAIILGYSIPLIFGYLFKPILLPRYVSYLLVFIIILISVLINKISDKKYKYGVVLFLIFVTVGNHFTEQTFQQIYKKRIPSKPEYLKAIKFIQLSNFKNYTLKIEKMKSDEATKDAVNNYISHLGKKNNIDLIFQELDKKNKQNFWVICLMDINEKHCSLPVKIANFNILEEKYFNSINLKLVQIP